MILPRATPGNVARLALIHAPVSPRTTWSFVELTADDGSRGVGEASLPQHAAQLEAAFVAARSAMKGVSLASVVEFAATRARATLADAAIASAIEQAAWDLRARRAGVPLWTELEGNGSRCVPLYANINRRTADRSTSGFLRSATEAAAAGFRAFKIAPFDDVTPQNVDTPEGSDRVREGLARAAAAREAIGPDRELYVDCHWRFTPESAAAAIDALSELRVTWFECPLQEHVDALPALARLRTRANARGMRLAGLEQLCSESAFAPWLDAGAYDVVMPDVKYCGGIAELIAIGREAARRGVACAPHNPSGPVSHAASLAACSALGEPLLLEHQWDETPWFFAIGGQGLPRPANGASALPSVVGLGVDLELAALGERVVRI